MNVFINKINVIYYIDLGTEKKADNKIIKKIFLNLCTSYW